MKLNRDWGKINMKFKPLGEFVTLNQGLAINKGTSHLVSEEKSEEFCYPLLRIADMMENSFCKYISKNVNPSVIASSKDIIYTRTGQIGLVFRNVVGVVHNNSFIVNLMNEELDKDYLFTVLCSPFVKNQALSLAKNSVQPDLTHDMFKSIVIPVPEKEIQIKIAKEIEAINSKIENNNNINIELESMAKTIYDYWFLQYEFPDEKGKQYKSSGGKMVWNEELKRKIPEGWEVKLIGDSIKKSKNGDWGNEEVTSQDDIKVNCFRGADFISITKDFHMTAPIRYIKKSNSDRLLEDGDLITEISGGSPTQSTGRIGYINEKFLQRSENVMDCSNFCKAFTPINKNYQFWLYQTWQSLYESGAMFNYESKTTGIKNLMFDDFIGSIYLAYPSEKLLLKYQEMLGLFYNKIQENLKQNQELASLRDFLLPMLMNGQVGFKEGEE